MLLAQLHQLSERAVVQIHVRARFVDQVDGLIRQEAVGDIAFGKDNGLPCDLRRDHNAVIGLVVVRNAAQDRNGFVDGRLRHDHRLEPALQRGVLFNVLAVFREGRRADDLDLSARERRLEDIRRVHRAFGVARTDQIVYLVDHKNDVAELFDLFDEPLHAAFKLTAELRARDQRRQIH